MQPLLIELNKLGVKLRMEGDELKVNAPQGVMTKDLLQSLREHKQDIITLLRTQNRVEQELPQLVADSANRHAPFALTDLQHAYWLGRDSAMEMGNVATHLYVELDCEPLDIERLNQALDLMIARHDMLRAIVDRDGRQRILAEVPAYSIALCDTTGQSEVEGEQAALRGRDALSHQVLKADQWPLFEVRATRLPSQRLRLHVSLDLLILDAWSIFLFFKEWHQLYLRPDQPRAPFEISFREYVLADLELQKSSAAQQAHEYWLERIEHLPAAPALPLRSDLSARQSPRFSRREARLPRERWQKLRANASTKGLTASGLLLSCYSEVLARWSSTPHFTLNVTVSHRQNMHREVNDLLGDFTSLVMEEVDWRDANSTFLERATRQQKQFQTDLDNRAYSGVSVMREWAKRRGISLQAAMPVVFSSGLIWSGDEEPGDLEQFGKKVFSVSQTSQVWLDHHVMELGGDLTFIWDAADAVFEEGVLDAMFAAYCQIIERLADDESLWHAREIVDLPPAMAARRSSVNVNVNATADTLPTVRLHGDFVAQAQKTPDAVAVIAAGRTLTYGQLLAESCAVANALLDGGAEPGKPVAVLMRKGWEQIVAVFGILLAGAAYMPIDADLPAKRQLDLLQIGEVKQVLVQSGVARDELNGDQWCLIPVAATAGAAFDARHAASLQGPLDEMAYVIFTSGTTGAPKGVMIDHRGAVNTNLHVNRLFGVGANDRTLAVSSLSFDLSVYDIFGLLAVGGAIVIPDYRKGHDPIHWRDLIEMHHVTLWNSAPQLMRMLMDSFYADELETADIRNVLLSGDFIPLDLPDRIRARYSQANVTSLGGATEASIWSIYYPVGQVLPGWQSIPYGKPLPNQTIMVLDHAFRPCADQVKGRIYIGGIGLAMGYWRDQAKTNERFLVHPGSGERLYDTGDLGRYAVDGNVLIMGRDDGQIKIRGHRVELGEIETVLRKHASVKHAIVVASANRENRQLVAYLEFIGGVDAAPETQELKDWVADHLPNYMVPRAMVALEQMPVSGNGKIDYKALPVIQEEDGENGEKIAPRNEIEQIIYDAWQRVIPGLEVGVTDNFFELGGDSVLATQLVRELNAALSMDMEMHELFENLTIEALAQLYESRCGGEGIDGNQAGPDYSALRHDISDTLAQLDALDFAATGAPQATLRAAFITGASGWVGAHVLAELLRSSALALYPLVRAADTAQAKAHLLASLQRHGIVPEAHWAERLHPVCGDLQAPRLGLSEAHWQTVAQQCDAVFHLAASKNVLHDYAIHRQNNVAPLAAVITLAHADHLKPLFAISPMTVCRRNIDGHLAVHAEEAVQDSPDGLLTGYAQSKWAGEQILHACAGRGLLLRIYRSSHALPSAATAQGQEHDTYGTVLKVACLAGSIPDWQDSALHGVPVDVLARLLVEDALGTPPLAGAASNVVHVENRDPLDFTTLLGALLEGRNAPLVSLQDWKEQCLQAAASMAVDEATLVQVLFTRRASGTAIENMFSSHPLHIGHFEHLGQAARLANLTPPVYWQAVARHANWNQKG